MSTVSPLAFFAIATLTAGHLQGPPSGASVPIPQGVEVLKVTNALACDAVLVTSIEPSSRTKRLEASSTVGKDKIAMQVQGRTLRFMTRRSVESGIASPAEFQILQNDQESLVAIETGTGTLGSTVNSVVVNKRNGLAVWTKSRSSFLFDSEPDGQMLYLACR
jgi:hypothetical protein